MMLLKKCNGLKSSEFCLSMWQIWRERNRRLNEGQEFVSRAAKSLKWVPFLLDVFWQGRPEDMCGFIDYCIHAIEDEYRGILLIYPVLFVPLYFSYN